MKPFYPDFRCKWVPDVPEDGFIIDDFELRDRDLVRLDGVHKGDQVSDYFGYPEIQRGIIAREKAAQRIGAMNLFFMHHMKPADAKDGATDWESVYNATYYANGGESQDPRYKVIEFALRNKKITRFDEISQSGYNTDKLPETVAVEQSA